MRRLPLLVLSGLLLCLSALHAVAADKTRYVVDYSVRFQPKAGTAVARIETRPDSGRLIALDLAMPASIYGDVAGDGSVTRNGDRVLWTPPRAGGALHYTVAVAHRRANGQFDGRMTPTWVITRGDRLFPPARVRATKGSGSQARLTVELPQRWTDVETPYSKVKGGHFAVTNAERNFDRPVGWIAAGDLTSLRETIAGVRVTVAAPRGERIDHVANLAILRLALPQMGEAFGKLPEKLLLVRAGDPMWRGGLSAPSSLWLHADRPLLSENGTSPLLHELTHVLTNIRGAGVDDWISEGIAEFYSLEIGLRAGLISPERFQKSIDNAARAGGKVGSLRSRDSSRDRTRKAVAVFAALDAELRDNDRSSLDELTQRLMRRETVTLDELRADAEMLEGRASTVLRDLD